MARKRKMSAKARKAALRNLRKARAAQRPRRRRSARRAARASRRTVRRMARRKRSGGRRKQLKITPKFVAKGAVFLAGLKMINDGDLKGFLNYVAQNPKALTDPQLYAMAAKRFGPGALVAFVGPKVVDKGAQLLNKGLPGTNRVANAVIVRV